MEISQSPGSLHRGTQEFIPLCANSWISTDPWYQRGLSDTTLSHTPPQSLEVALNFYGGKQTIGNKYWTLPTTNQKWVTLSVSGLNGSITAFHLVQINSGKTGEHTQNRTNKWQLENMPLTEQTGETAELRATQLQQNYKLSINLTN